MTLPPPLVIQTPLSGEHFGPGFVISGGLGVGPLPTTDAWTITLRGGPTGAETELSTGLGSRNLNFNEVAWYANNVAQLVPAPSSVVSPVNAELVIRLLRNSTEILEEARVPIVPDWYSGTPFLLATRQTTAGGGFNASDRSNLDLVLGAVRAVMPPALTGGASLAMQVIDLVRGPPRSFLRRFGQQLLSGRGTLSAQPPGAAHSFGGTWSFVTVPAGYGRDDGALVEYHRRFVQFVVVRDELTSDTYLDVLEDSNYEGAFILWQFPNPLQIQYDVAPGVQVLWQWLV